VNVVAVCSPNTQQFCVIIFMIIIIFRCGTANDACVDADVVADFSPNTWHFRVAIIIVIIIIIILIFFWSLHETCVAMVAVFFPNIRQFRVVVFFVIISHYYYDDHYYYFFFWADLTHLMKHAWMWVQSSPSTPSSFVLSILYYYNYHYY